MHLNLILAVVIFAMLYVYVSAGLINKDLFQAIAWTASILTVISFVRSKPITFEKMIK